ncbi:GumC family protein [Larkinella knui]|uniref:Polysaccharide biosynthesis tyrosine autokinase n=1 Tax=Larkinella knui TaxID=2025310 RepID=A0A3P1CVU8_9BACT|nr:tyrosine-protein kinase [Larkinella knui]RRB17441.1 polysaccharide biosynthesis tyrosine autokinase [Larkinella knui]
MVSNQFYYEPSPSRKLESPNLSSIFLRYKHYWKWFIGSVTLMGALSVAYALKLSPVYSIQASLMINDEKKGSFEEKVLKEQQIFIPKKVVENETEVLKSTMLMTKVVERLNLNVFYSRPGTFRNQQLYEDSPIILQVLKPNESLYTTALSIQFVDSQTVLINQKPYPVNQVITTPFGQLRLATRQPISPKVDPVEVQVMPVSKVVSSYLKSLKVEPTSKTSTVLLLSIEETIPQKGMALLTQLIEEYNRAAIEEKNRMAINTLKFIESRLSLIGNDLAAIEKEVESYKSAEGITDLSSQAGTLLQTVKENDAQLNQVMIQLRALENMEDYIENKAGDLGTAPNTLGLNDPVLLQMVTKLSDLELQRRNLASTMNELNPLVQSLDDQIRSVKSNIRENIQTLRQTLTGTQRELQAVSQHNEGLIRRVPKKDRVLLNITRQQKIKNDLYTYLLQKREEAALSYASTVSDSRVVDKPYHSGIPVKPRKSYLVLLGVLLGFLLPIGVIFTRDLINGRILRRSDVEQATQVPILAELVQNPGNPSVGLLPQSRSLIDEQIRMLRTRVQFLRNETQTPVILITSSVSGEGKSFVSANLGASLAMADHPTLVLEMDLRNPQIHPALGVDNSIGITEYLQGQATLDSILREVPGQKNYWIITSGQLPTHPAELLGSPRLPALIDELRSRFSYVLIDSSPVSLVTDAQLIAAHVDATLFIVRCDVTPKKSLKTLESLYQEQRFQRLNVVLNGVNEQKPYYHQYATTSLKRSQPT